MHLLQANPALNRRKHADIYRPERKFFSTPMSHHHGFQPVPVFFCLTIASPDHELQDQIRQSRHQKSGDADIDAALQETDEMKSVILISPASFCPGKDQPVRCDRTHQQPVHDDQVNDIPGKGNDPGIEEDMQEGIRCIRIIQDGEDGQDHKESDRSQPAVESGLFLLFPVGALSVVFCLMSSGYSLTISHGKHFSSM